MDWEPAAIHIVGFFAEQVEKLGIAHGNKEVEAIVSITHDEEQGSFPVSQSVQLQLIIGRDLTQLCNVEYRKARTTGNQDRLGCFSSGQLIFLILAHRKVVWLLGFQCVKHQVYGVFELLVILPDFHGVDELNEGGEVLLLHRSLIVDIAISAQYNSFLLLPKNRLRPCLRLWYWRSAL